MRKLIANGRRHLSNIPGWRSGRKILVIESDDWGSVRMPSRKVFETLRDQGLQVDAPATRHYNYHDTLAGSDDLNRLFESLQSMKDHRGRSLSFTAMSLVANPDFERIREEGFNKYHYESLRDSLQRYYPGEDVFRLWLDGRAAGVFVPQFHGREHLNVAAWMRMLRNPEGETRKAFEQGTWAFIPSGEGACPGSLQAAFELCQAGDRSDQEAVLKEGLALFRHLFGYPASFFAAPNGPFNHELEGVTGDAGVRYISVAKIRKVPLDSGRYHTRFHWLGQKNQFGQHYLIRNAFFEPSARGRDWVGSCLKEIDIAFRWGKPAIISSHRVNYMGVHDPNNRENGIRELELLIRKLLRQHPDTEFMNSHELGDLITKNQ